MEAVAESEGTAPRSLGQTFAAERERQGLSRADVAQRLHMSAYQVEALENCDYARLPQGTFLRGFVRNYAKVLGLAPDPLVALLGDGPVAAKRPGIVVPDESIRFDPTGQALNNPYVKATAIAFVVIALGFAAMYWWLFVRPSPPATTVQRPAPAAEAPAPVAPRVVAEAPASVPAATSPASPANNGSTSSAATVAGAPGTQPATPSTTQSAGPGTPPAAPSKSAPPPSTPAIAAAAATKAPASTAAPATPSTADAKKSAEPTLKFVFKGQSWVEVRDSKGKLLFSRLNAAGSTEEVSGKPPFNVVVGNAPEVQLYYNDHEFDLEPHTKVAVARFTVE